MKQKFLLLYLLCLFTAMPFGAKAQSTMTYTLNFDPSDFTINRINGDTSIITSTKYVIYSNYDPTQPELPVIYVTYLLPPNATYENFTYTKTETVFADNVLLLNGQLPVSTDGINHNPQGVWYEPCNYSSSIDFSQIPVLGGYRMMTFKVMPFSYNAQNGSVCISRFTLNIQLSPFVAEEENIELSTSTQELVKDNIIKTIENKELFNTFYPSTNQRKVLRSRNSIEEENPDYYLIITSEALQSSFANLLAWKKQKGLKGEIVTIEHIADSFNVDLNYNNLTPLQVKTFLRNKYQRTRRVANDMYVLLGGGTQIIPTTYCKAPNTGDNLSTESIPCDYYYSCFGGAFDWDGNGNGVIGEVGDNIDFSPYIYVSRIPLNSNSEISAFTTKVINYEQNPPQDWGDKFLSVGSLVNRDTLYHFGPGPDTLPGNDWIYMSDVDSLLSLQNVSIGTFAESSGQAIQFYTLYDSSSNLYNDFIPYDNSLGSDSRELLGHVYINRPRILEQLNSNYSIVHEASHGTLNKWVIDGTIYNTYFDNYWAEQISTLYPKVLLSCACHTAGFDYSDCFAKAVLKSDSSGIVAYIGNTREGFIPNLQTLPDSSYRFSLWFGFSNNFFNHLIADPYHINGHLGKVCAYSKNTIPLNNVELWLKYSINLLGDPEMMVYTQTPKRADALCELYNVYPEQTNKLLMNEDSIFLDFKLILKGQDQIYHFSGANAWYEMDINADSIDVIVLKQNYIPTVYRLYCNGYLQNKTISQNAEYAPTYHKVHVGKDVTDERNEGTVVVNVGKKLNLKAKKEIQIKNGFTVESGGTFEMNIEE